MLLGLLSGSAEALTVTGVVNAAGNVGILDLGLNTVQGTGSGSCAFLDVAPVLQCDAEYNTFSVDLPTGLEMTSIVAEVLSRTGVTQGSSFDSSDGTILNTAVTGVSASGNILNGLLIGPSLGLGQYLIQGLLNPTGAGAYSYDWKLSFTTQAVSDVPIPAALPLFAAGLSAMGFMGWRRKRKAAGAG